MDWIGNLRISEAGCGLGTMFMIHNVLPSSRDDIRNLFERAHGELRSAYSSSSVAHHVLVIIDIDTSYFRCGLS